VGRIVETSRHLEEPRRRVVVVDDDTMYLRSIQRILRTPPPSVELRVFERAVPAIEALIEHPADLVLLDVRLPDLSGIEACRILKKATSSPIVIVSSHLSTEVREMARDAGADGMLPKPYDLLAVLDGCRGNEPSRSTDKSSLPQLLSIDHVNMARNIAHSLARRYRAWLSDEDIEGLALLGLCEAAVRYDPERNGLFIAFAERRVRGAILDAVRKIRSESHGEVGRQALHPALDEAGYSVNLRSQEDATVAALPSNDPSSEMIVAQQQLSMALLRARQHLSMEEAQVIHRRYDLGHSIESIAAELKISTRRAALVHARGLAKLCRQLT
jgi:RNA polymerase sigma factor (sigma-70 family)